MNDTGTTREQDRRKPYTRPELVRYGNVSELTRGWGGSGTADAFGGSSVCGPSPVPRS